MTDTPMITGTSSGGKSKDSETILQGSVSENDHMYIRLSGSAHVLLLDMWIKIILTGSLISRRVPTYLESVQLALN
jgi:hypothetical protein